MNDDRQTPPRDAAAPPRPDDGADDDTHNIGPPQKADPDAPTFVPVEDAASDRAMLLVGGFPMAELDPRLRLRRADVFTRPVYIGGFPKREAQPLFAMPPPLPLSRPEPPPLPEFAVTVEPPALPVVTMPPPELEPAAVAAAPIEIAVLMPASVMAGLSDAEAMASEPIKPVEPLEPLEALAPAPAPHTIRKTSTIATRPRVAVALAVAASIALLSWIGFRAQRQVIPEAPASASIKPVAPAARETARQPATVDVAPAEAEPTSRAPEPIANAIVPPEPRPRVKSVSAERSDTERPAMRRATPTLVRWPSRPAVLPTMPTRPLPRPTPPTPTPTPQTRQTIAASATPAPVRETPAPMPTRSAMPAPAAVIDTPPAVIAATTRVPSEEDNVRATLARWRAAYSRLDARAAKGVYPSLDERALERAFQNLKSQDVRFDRCELTLRDESAQADCVGRAIYVPRIGSQSPITAPRAWRFDLKRNDQVWTIASARSS